MILGAHRNKESVYQDVGEGEKEWYSELVEGDAVVQPDDKIR